MPRIIVAFSLLATGCGRFKSPSTVVHSLYMDCLNGEYPKARNLFIRDIREDFDGAVTANGPGIKGTCDRLTRSGTLATVDIQYEFIKGDHAVVVSDLHFQDDTVKHDEHIQLVREDGAWKVSQ